MRRMIFAVVAVLLVIGAGVLVVPPALTQAGCAPGVTYSAAPGSGDWWATYTASVNADVALVTQFWSATFPQLFGGSYPGVCATVEYEPLSVPFAEICGLTPEIAANNAFYCIPANTVMWDGPGFFHPIYANFGDKAITYIIAHEYGHAAQFLSGVVPPGPRTVNIELQADCYAGAFLGYAQAQGYLSDGDAREIISIALAVGQSRVGTRWLDRSHGTSAQRTAALNRGYDNGAAACQLSLEDAAQFAPARPGDRRDGGRPFRP